MPGLNGTGPRGEGPMTGGARGFCGSRRAGLNPEVGRGYGIGRGRGGRRGFGQGFGRGFGRFGVFPFWGGRFVPDYDPVYDRPNAMSREEEISTLRARADMVKEELDGINKRLELLDSESSS